MDSATPAFSEKELIELVRQKMPFGKYAGRLLCDVPLDYLVWMECKGWPEGRLGRQLAMVHTIKGEGVAGIFAELKRRYA